MVVTNKAMTVNMGRAGDSSQPSGLGRVRGAGNEAGIQDTGRRGSGSQQMWERDSMAERLTMSPEGWRALRRRWAVMSTW